MRLEFAVFPSWGAILAKKTYFLTKMNQNYFGCGTGVSSLSGDGDFLADKEQFSDTTT